MADGETLPLLLPLLSKVSVRSMLALAGHMALTLSRLVSPPLAPLVARRRSTSLTYVSVTVLMLGCPHRRHIPGSIVAYRLRLLGIGLVLCKSAAADFRIVICHVIVIVVIAIVYGKEKFGEFTTPRTRVCFPPNY